MSVVRDLQITPASRDERPVIENLFQLYVHDFSEQWVGRDIGELGDDGRFDPDPHLGSYWREADRTPWLVRRGGHPVGFALVNSHSHHDAAIDHAIAEFFIVRKHRRGGLGTLVARTLFDRTPGRWETAIVRTNAPARGFWRQAAEGHPDCRDLVESDVNDSRWNGWVLNFTIAP